MKAALALLLAACWTQSSSQAPIANTSNVSAPPVANKQDLCERLLAHLIDLEFAKFGGNTSAPEVTALRDRVVAEKLEFTQACVERTPRDRIECALAATDMDALARCDSPGSRRPQ